MSGTGILLSVCSALFLIALLLAVGLLLRCFLRARSVTRRCYEAMDNMLDMLAQAERDGRFSTQCANPSLAPCWEIKKCGDTECAAYGKRDQRCWQLTGLRCQSNDGGKNLFERVKDCQDCAVFTAACSDVVSRLTEQFNNVMVALQQKADELIVARRHVQQASKLASVGEFAAGLAHEINNPLDGILSCLSRLERDPANLRQNIEYLRLMHEALNRICVAVQHLLEYSQKHELQFEPTHLEKVVQNVVTLMGASARQKALHIELDFQDALPPVLGDKYYLEQVFLNLTLNAVAATAEGGTITFRTTSTLSEEGEPGAVQVEVIDTGTGIEASDLPKVFDPFFTTKDPGKGTGLGLAIVKGIVEEHRGRVAMASTPGVGTSVSIVLPAALEDATHGALQEASS